MKLISEAELNYLTQTNLPLSLSILTPTHRRITPDTNHIDRTNYKNQLNLAGQKLSQAGVGTKHIKKILQDAYSLVYKDDFWTDLSDGLAVYIQGGKTSAFKLPVRFDNFTYLNDHFYIKPLMPVLANNGRFFILSLSQNEVKFFEGRKYSISDVKIDDLVPLSMEEAMKDVVFEPSLQSHSGGIGQAAVFHGHGGGKVHQEIALSSFLQTVDRGLMKMLHDETIPMVIASVDELATSFRQISNYPFIVEENISGNPEHISPVFLHEKAWEILKDNFKESYRDDQKRFQDNLHKGNSSTESQEIFKKAIEGRIDSLFTSNADNLWGSYDANSHKITFDPVKQVDSTCLLNLATIYTLQYGGTAYNVSPQEMPIKDAEIAALFRF